MHRVYRLKAVTIFLCAFFFTLPAMAVEAWRITEIFSNSDGSVQYIKLSTTKSDQHLLAGQTLRAFDANGKVGQTFVFPTDLISAQTANTSVLIGTDAFSAYTQLHVDYRLPAGFLFTNGGSVRLGNIDLFSYQPNQLPRNGFQALSTTNAAITAAPVNFSGQTKAIGVEVTSVFNDATGIVNIPVVDVPGSGVANASLQLTKLVPYEFTLVEAFFYDNNIAAGPHAARFQAGGKLYLPNVRVGAERYELNMTLLDDKAMIFGNLEVISVRPEPVVPARPPVPGIAALLGGKSIVSPDTLTLVGGQMSSNAQPGTSVGRFALTPAAAQALYSFEFVSGAGAEHNHLFSISAGQLLVNRDLSAEPPRTLTIRVRASGPAGHSLEESFNVALISGKAYPGIFRISTREPNLVSTPFPVVEAFLTINEDLEAPTIHWFARAGETYAIERSNDEVNWRLISDARYITANVSGPTTYRDDFTDLFSTPSRYYRVRHISAPVESVRDIELPPSAVWQGKPEVSLQSGRSIIQLPTFEDILSEPTGRADYYELYIPTSIGAQWRSTNPSFALQLSRNFTQGAKIDVYVLSYTWSGELVAATIAKPHYGHFDEFSVPEMLTDKPPSSRQNPNWLGLVNIYGSALKDSLSVYYNRTDPTTRSRMLGIVLRRDNVSFPDYGAFTIFLPNGVREGQLAWTSPAAYNVSSVGFTGMQMYYAASSTNQLGAWSVVYPDFHWSTLGWPNSVASSGSRGYFDIREVRRDSYNVVHEINLHFSTGAKLGTLYFVFPAHRLP